jgi:oligopeptide transport system permease protein
MRRQPSAVAITGSAPTHDWQPAAGDFLPVTASSATKTRQRPSLSYWQDAWRRLRQNRRAMLSLAVLLLVLAMTALGPLLWRVDPAQQQLDQVSRAPNLGHIALLVPDHSHWDGNAGVGVSETGITTFGTPHTEGVRLLWSATRGATAYAVYRHELQPSGSDDLGLPLATVGDRYYEDRLALEPRSYYYSIVPVRDGEDIRAFSTLKVSVRQALTLSDARLRAGPHGAGLEVGDEMRLQAQPLGTDYLGRDMLARIIHGARTSLLIGITAPLVFVLIGLVYGGVAGYLGGRIDNLMMRVADFVIALPFLLFMILFKVAFGIAPGESGVMPMLVALILLGWPASARLVRGQVLAIREEAYVQAARLMGASTAYLIGRHMLPNVTGVLLVSISFAIPAAIFTEAFLSFIGLGVAPPVPSWGSMCNDGMRSMLSYPHELIVPALFISITVLAFNLLGDGLRDALDVRMRST